MPADLMEPLSTHWAGKRTYEQGDILSFDDELLAQSDLTIIKSGSIEIFERSDCAEFYAYRPVKIFEKGAMFGLFDFNDRYWGWPPLPKAKESWEVAAGRGATFLLTNVPDDLTEEMYGDVVTEERLEKKDTSYEPRDLLEVLLPVKKVELEFYKFKDPQTAMADCPLLLGAIQRACSESAREYRQSRNLYNQEFYDAILHAVLAKLTRATTGMKADSLWGKLGAIPKKNFLIPEIIYATIEALERPALNNPMFFKSSQMARKRPAAAGSENYKHLTLRTVLHAHHPEEALNDPQLSAEMYYPLGFQNLSINRFMARWWDFSKNTEAAGNLKRFFSPTTRAGKSAAKSGATAKPVPAAADFGLKQILELVIAAFKAEYRKRKMDYPFEVEARIDPTGDHTRFVPVLVVSRKKA